MFIGIDPGARDTAVVAVLGRGVVADVFVGAATVSNTGVLLPVPVDYFAAVRETVVDFVGRCSAVGRVVGCVEGVRRPSWHVNVRASRGAASDPTALLATSMVAGFCVALFDDVVVVPPGRNGKGMLGEYPGELVGVRERTGPDWKFRRTLASSKAKKRHERSAWDIAVKGAGLWAKGNR